jgi:oxygen-independent coproporphyrinogen-3 oxidase
MLAFRRHRAPEEWAALVERDGHGITATEQLTPEDRAREALLMGLRLAEGVDPARIASRTGVTLQDALDARMLEACLEEGYLAWRDGRLLATPEGRLRLDAMLPAILR